MGALHEGHAALMRLAREQVATGQVVASVFVNPLQFGAGEDLDRYPRTLDDGPAALRTRRRRHRLRPVVEEVYPGGDPQVTLDPGPVAARLEGRTRPGHFRGVLTVVAKLFGLVRPDVAVFGQKDYQQLVLIRRMTADLCLPVRVLGAETEREADGLALSSRNRYLDPGQRLQATALHRALLAARLAAVDGRDAALEAARAELRTAEGIDLDYLEITDPQLGEMPDVVPPGTEGRILVAARLGSTRLIDNLPLVLGGTAEGTA